MSTAPAIHPDLLALFEFTRARVTDKDIEMNVPDDPGYWNYVEVCQEIRRTGGIPFQYSTDLEEVINLTRWAKPNAARKPKSLLAFRRFTSAIRLIQIFWGLGDDFGESNLAHNLLTDLTPGDPRHLDLLRRAFAFIGQFLKDRKGFIPSEEYPFFTLGGMILAEWAGDHVEAGYHAEKLLLEAEENWTNRSPGQWNQTTRPWTDPASLLPIRKNGRFLFCLTSYCQFEAEWSELVSKLKNPGQDPRLAQVMDLMAGAAPGLRPE